MGWVDFEMVKSHARKTDRYRRRVRGAEGAES